MTGIYVYLKQLYSPRLSSAIAAVYIHGDAAADMAIGLVRKALGTRPRRLGTPIRLPHLQKRLNDPR
jgi:hypothetical protein